MADRIKTVSTYTGTEWGPEVPIGVDASNVDVELDNDTTGNLQAVLGTVPTTIDSEDQVVPESLTSRLSKKVDIVGGDVSNTVMVSGIDNYDSSSGIDSNILTDTAAVTTSGNNSQAALWTRFNLFRKKVSNKFGNYFETSNILTSLSSSATASKVYSATAINSYLSSVIGYGAGSSAPSTTIKDQLSTLNTNANTINKFMDSDRYLYINNRHPKLSVTSTEITSTNLEGGTFLKYTKENTGRWLHNYTTGGIYSITDKNLVLLVLIHINVSCVVSSAASGAWIAINIMTKPQGTDSYSNYSQLGTTVAYSSGTSRTVSITKTTVITLEGYEAFGVALAKATTNTTSANADNGYVQVQPLSRLT